MLWSPSSLLLHCSDIELALCREVEHTQSGKLLEGYRSAHGLSNTRQMEDSKAAVCVRSSLLCYWHGADAHCCQSAVLKLDIGKWNTWGENKQSFPRNIKEEYAIMSSMAMWSYVFSVHAGPHEDPGSAPVTVDWQRACEYFIGLKWNKPEEPPAGFSLWCRCFTLY